MDNYNKQGANRHRVNNNVYPAGFHGAVPNQMKQVQGVDPNMLLMLQAQQQYNAGNHQMLSQVNINPQLAANLHMMNAANNGNMYVNNNFNNLKNYAVGNQIGIHNNNMNINNNMNMNQLNMNNVVPQPNQQPAKTGKLYLEDEYGLFPLIRLINDASNVNPNANYTQAQREEGNFIYLLKGFQLNTLGFKNKLQAKDNICCTASTLFLDDEGDMLHSELVQHQGSEDYNLEKNGKKYYVLPDYKLPDTYKKPKPKELSMKTFSQFKDETLLYVFYSMPKDVLHLAAAKTLYERKWRYHKVHQFWFQFNTDNTGKRTVEEVKNMDGKGPAFVGIFKVFDPSKWKSITQKLVIFEHDIEEERVLKEAMEKAAAKSRERQQQQLQHQQQKQQQQQQQQQ